ncbi:hypothetical protein CLV24_101249 [Pontibacter ummariensis]|uniref:Uncharacterized protein n=1 Tax=Pontibacter ummariensis TaxID=1610492 RepID=A0A239B9E6_9BACT|nr:DUF6141 family protein [Pontibacter ummariensis]PRY16403.1 hypothetical protein CLV24_101249 [Pontibacter ummariensis]SNS04556.1 hypothetical protein SAMN06296052_101249 [Pontibacter ummariensis]
MAGNHKILYREQQRFRQFWLWVVVLGVAAIFWAGLVTQVMFGGQFGDNPVSDVELVILFVAVGLGLPYFFYKMTLTTEVQPGVLQVRFWPFHLRPVRIPLHTVRDYEQVVYNPIGDYGGWGIRWSFRGKAYNISGNEGVQLLFYNRKPLLIGSQNPQRLFEAIRQAKEMG